MFYITIDENNRVMASCEEQGVLVGEIEVETLPDGELGNYLYIGGEYVHDPTLEIARLKQKLSETDYIVIKIAEGTATWEDYPDVKEQRQVWRDEINKLESERGDMNG